MVETPGQEPAYLPGQETAVQSRPPFCGVQGCRGRWQPDVPHDLCRRAADEGILLLANRISAALETCQNVERNPDGWGGSMALSLARTIRRDLIGNDGADLD